MNTDSGFPLWFPFAFVFGWLLISTLMAFASGWRQLAAKYRANGTTIGCTFYFQSAAFGDSWLPVSYRNCLTFAVGAKGFFVEPMLIFRFLCPRLFIPWHAVETIEVAAYWFLPSFRLKLVGSCVTIWFFGHVATAMLEAWTASRSSLETQKVS